MNKQDLVNTIVADKESGIISKAAAERAVNSFINAVNKGIKQDGEVQLLGFGTFKIKTRSARNGRNPMTGKPLKIKASKIVAFKCSAFLKDLAKKSKSA